MIEILNKYWSQIVVLIGAIGFVIRIFFDHKVKIKEAKSDKLYENKILEIKSFYKSYHCFSVNLKEFYFQIHFGKHDPEIFSQIRQKIYKSILDYELSSLTVKLFLSERDIILIDKVSSELELVRQKLEIWLIDRSTPSDDDEWKNVLAKSSKKLNEEIPLIIKEIEVTLRRSLGA